MVFPAVKLQVQTEIARLSGGAESPQVTLSYMGLKIAVLAGKRSEGCIPESLLFSVVVSLN